MKNLRKDNRGLTFVEVMVAIAISTVVIGAIWQFMLVSTKTYQTQKITTDLQQEVQQTLSQAENLVIDVDRAVEYKVEGIKKTLEIYCSDKIGKLIWNQDDKTLTYTETAVTNELEGSVTKEVVSNYTESAILAEGVEEFDADVSKVESNKVLKIAMTFARGDRTYKAARNISLRNLVTQEGDITKIYNNNAAPVKKPTIEFANLPSVLQPGKTYDDLSVTVKDADNPNVFWTIQDAASINTTIDAATGVLTVGIDEQQDVPLANRKLTIVVTLVEDTSVSVSKVIKVTDAPTVDIEIEEFPEIVLYGEEYSIDATVNPDMYTLQWAAAAGSMKFNTNTGKMQVLWQQKEKVDQIIAKAFVTVGSQEEFVEARAKIRHPEFSINVDYENEPTTSTTTTPSTFEQGYNVKLSANWAASYLPNGNYMNGNESVSYQNGLFDGETIIWKYAINDSKEYNLIDGNVFKLPVGVDIYQVRIMGMWDDNTHIACEKTITLQKPSIVLEAFIDDSNIGTGPVPFGKQVVLRPRLVGVNNAEAEYINWSVSVKENKNLAVVWKNDTTSANFTLNNTELRDKTIEVKVKDNTTKLVAQLDLEVTSYVDCKIADTTTPTEEFNYLYVNKSGEHQNPFFIEVANMALVDNEVEPILYNQNNQKITNFDEVLEIKTKEDGLLCIPKGNSISTLEYIIIHLDNKYTGAHMAIYKIYPTVANFGNKVDNETIWYSLPYTADNLEDANRKDVSKTTVKYDNFYGMNVDSDNWADGESTYPQDIAYSYAYDFYEDGWIIKTNYCKLTITDANSQRVLMEKTYKRSWSLSGYYWNEVNE